MQQVKIKREKGAETMLTNGITLKSLGPVQGAGNGTDRFQVTGPGINEHCILWLNRTRPFDTIVCNGKRVRVERKRNETELMVEAKIE